MLFKIPQTSKRTFEFRLLCYMCIYNIAKRTQKKYLHMVKIGWLFKEICYNDTYKPNGACRYKLYVDLQHEQNT